MLEPRSVALDKPAIASGNVVVRSLRALIVERRLPTALAILWDQFLIRIGQPLKTIRVGKAKFRVRRQTSDEHYVREVATDETYFPPNYEIRSGDTVVDVGANIGSFAIEAARRADPGRVISVEPVSGNFRMLKRNKEFNLAENLVILQAAVTDQPGKVSIYICEEGQGSHSIHSSLARSSESEEVAGYSLASLFEKFSIETCSFLKLDCEGAEFPIVENLQQPLADRIDRIVLEYHITSGSKHESALKLLNKLVSLGYSIDDYTDILGTEYGLIYARRSHTKPKAR